MIRPCRPLLSALLFLLASVACAQAAPPLPQLTHLGLDVRIDYPAERLAGTATLTLRNAGEAPIARVPLLLNRLMRATAIHDADGAALSFGQRIATFDDVPKWQVDAVDVELARPLAPGASVRLAVGYEGHLAGYTEVGMLYVQDRIARDFTILREDALAFPVVGVPSARTNRAAPRVPFGFELAVTVPEGLVVANGGEPAGRSERGGEVTWRYRSREPAPHLIAAIAPYRVAEAGGLRVFHFPADGEGAAAVIEASERAIARYRGIFGPLDRPLAVGIIQIPEGWGSQASLAGGIIQDSAAFRDRAQLPQLYHELSHLWNAPETETPFVRWNEGLATFMQGRLARELDGWDGEDASLERTASRLLEQCGGGQPCGRVPMRDYGRERLTDHAYLVGRMMFAALHRTLGEETFDRALRQHFQAHRSGGGSTDDLVRAFVEAGGPAARRILDDWLDSAGWVSRLRDAGSAQTLFETYRQ